MEPFTLTIVGITSNLAQIKIIPTLYDLVAESKVSDDFSVIGVGRTPMDQQSFHAFISKTLRAKNRHHTHGIDPVVEQKLLSHLSYLPADLTNPESFVKLKELIKSSPHSKNRMYYLATFPSLYETIFHNLKSVGLTGQKNGWTRLVIEKPIGTDRDSAKALNDLLAEYFVEDQVFRLDHYLGKETLHDVLDFRFNQSPHESKITHEFVDHIQVSALEDFGIGLRGPYYDQNGAIKDVGQNHLLQMIALATMNKPSEFTNELVTQERVSILKNLVPDPETLVLGQYEGYHQEPSVGETSLTETYFAFKTSIDNDRFSGVPIYVRGGKYLTLTCTEIVIVFKNTDKLIYRIGGAEEGITLVNGTTGEKTTYTPTHGHEAPDAYERLLLDALNGDQTFFNDANEVDAQWVFTDALLTQKHGMQPEIYKRGTWGPKAADNLLSKDGRSWLI
jgi:glucose-6-phosphate 1-dehydrogenase